MKKPMREIKFRAWDRVNKIMTYNPINAINFEGQILLNDGKFYDIDKTDYILMQYTGLKDKKGKEIYEGDLAKSGEFIHQIIFKDGCFGFENINPINKISMNFAYMSKELARIIEVVGNIYENPELKEF